VRATLTANIHEVMQEVDASGVIVNTDVIEGDPVGAILDRAGAWGADLIVMGTHGRTGLERLVVGSVTEKVLRQAPCPVLTVPRRVVTPRSGLRLGRILCPVDFSRASLRAMDYAAAFASAGGPGVFLLHVIDLVGEAPGIREDDVIDPPDFRGELRAEARDRLKAAVPADIRARCSITEMVAMGTPHEEILRVARREGCELIVLGVPSRGTADLLVFGSTTQRVVREAECPVLTIRS
jgi:nucleotide-binding universal stress UspA family protein